MSKRKKKMTVKQLRALVAFLVIINIILLICVLVLGIFLAKANSGKARQQTVRLKKANDTYTVCVDAGHGGSDVGAVGLDGSYEKDDNLRLALKSSPIVLHYFRAVIKYFKYRYTNEFDSKRR